MSEEIIIPEGYSYAPSPSAYINHMGKVFNKRVKREDGTEEVWSAMLVEPHHVNSWGLCHGSVMAGLAEIGTAGPGWEPGGPAVVAIDMSMQFIGAPKLGDLIEICGTLNKRTRSLVFTSAKATVNGNVMFTASSIQKIIGA